MNNVGKGGADMGGAQGTQGPALLGKPLARALTCTLHRSAATVLTPNDLVSLFTLLKHPSESYIHLAWNPLAYIHFDKPLCTR